MKDSLDGVAGFQWDRDNLDKNLVKHQVNDWECEQVFFNQPLVILEDRKHSMIERRWAAFGRTDAGRPLVVVFTRRGKLIRVVSARSMSRRERKFYEESA
ncbi:MAG: BrnT family toxin [bacterium]